MGQVDVDISEAHDQSARLSVSVMVMDFLAHSLNRIILGKMCLSRVPLLPISERKSFVEKKMRLYLQYNLNVTGEPITPCLHDHFCCKNAASREK